MDQSVTIQAMKETAFKPSVFYLKKMTLCHMLSIVEELGNKHNQIYIMYRQDVFY